MKLWQDALSYDDSCTQLLPLQRVYIYAQAEECLQDVLVRLSQVSLS